MTQELTIHVTVTVLRTGGQDVISTHVDGPPGTDDYGRALACCLQLLCNARVVVGFGRAIFSLLNSGQRVPTYLERQFSTSVTALGSTVDTIAGGESSQAKHIN